MITVRRIVCLIVFYLLLPVNALSCSCGFSSVEQLYKNADSILIARLLNCVNDEVDIEPKSEKPPAQICNIETTDVLKGDDRESFTIDWVASSCFLYLEEGKSHLLFLKKNGFVIACGASGVLEPKAKPVTLKERLKAQQDGDIDEVNRAERLYKIATTMKVVRDFRDGVRKSLNLNVDNPWILLDTEFSCSLSQNLKEQGQPAHLTIGFMYTDSIPDWAQDGSLETRIITPALASISDYEPRAGEVSIGISFPQDFEISDDPGLFNIEGSIFPMQAYVYELIPTNTIHRSYYLRGSDAERVLASLLTAEDAFIVANAVKKPRPSLSKVPTEPQYFEKKIFAINTVGLSTEIPKLMNCGKR